jgi:hypothetical protein
VSCVPSADPTVPLLTPGCRSLRLEYAATVPSNSQCAPPRPGSDTAAGANTIGVAQGDVELAIILVGPQSDMHGLPPTAYNATRVDDQHCRRNTWRRKAR